MKIRKNKRNERTKITLIEAACIEFQLCEHSPFLLISCYLRHFIVNRRLCQGHFLIIGVTEDGFRDLSDDEIKKYLDLYELPQKFFFEDGELCVVKFRPNEGKSQNSKLLEDIWDKKYDPQEAGRTDEQQKRNRRMNKNLQELLCVLPEQLHNCFGNFVDSVFDLHEYEKKSAYQSGVEFGREMFFAATQ